MPFTKETAREAGKKGRAKQLRQAADRSKEPAELKLMRHVIQKPATADKTEEQRNYRAWLKENRNSFMKHYFALLDQARGAQARDAEESGEYMDEGTRRVLEILERQAPAPARYEGLSRSKGLLGGDEDHVENSGEPGLNGTVSA